MSSPFLLIFNRFKTREFIKPWFFIHRYCSVCSGISYFNIGFDCSTIPQKLLPYLDIFGTLITEIGTKNLDFIKFTKRKNILTGGFSNQFSIYNQRNNPKSYKPILWFNLKMLREYIPDGLSLLEDVLLNFEFKKTFGWKCW